VRASSDSRTIVRQVHRYFVADRLLQLVSIRVSIASTLINRHVGVYDDRIRRVTYTGHGEYVKRDGILPLRTAAELIAAAVSSDEFNKTGRIESDSHPSKQSGKIGTSAFDKLVMKEINTAPAIGSAAAYEVRSFDPNMCPPEPMHIIEGVMLRLFQTFMGQWTSSLIVRLDHVQLISHLNDGMDPMEIRLDKSIKTLKPLVVKWLAEAWLKLQPQRLMISTGCIWDKLGFAKLLDPTYQLAALKLKAEDLLNVNPEAELGEEKDQNMTNWNEDEEDDEADIDDNEEDGDVDTALAACIEHQLEIVEGARRSSNTERRTHCQNTARPIHSFTHLQGQG